MDILKHFLLTYYRNKCSNKLQTAINCCGLSIAIAVIIMIFFYVNSELTYDKFHTKADRIFRMTTTLTTPDGDNLLAFTNTAFANLLKEKCPEIENLTCVDIGGSYHMKYKERIFREDKIRQCTPGIFEIFSYKILRGIPKTFLTEPNTTVLTESLANKIFENEDPIGKIVAFEDKNYTITGVIQDLPENTDLKFNALISSSVDQSKELLDWENFYVYFLINKNSESVFQNKINEITEKTYKPLLTGDYKGISVKYTLQPLSDIHFNTSYLGDNPKGNKTNVYAFFFVAILILIIACINYINLNIAGAVTRYKEILIRKISGSGKKGIIIQLLGESVITIAISFIFSLVLVIIFLPVLNELTNKGFKSIILINPTIILLMLAIVFFIGIIAGIYPAFYHSHLVEYNGNLNSNSKNGFHNLSKTLVTLQFVLSIAMIISIMVVSKQINFMKSSDLGFNKDQILAISLNLKNDSINDLNSFKEELVKNPGISKIATGGGGTQLGSTGEWLKAINSMKNAHNEDIQFISNMPQIDENYLNLFEIKLIEGRNFSKDFPTDYEEGAIVNMAWVKTMGWKEPLNQTIYENSKLKVIGVVNDFHFASLDNKIEPLLFRFSDKNPAYLFVKASPNEVKHVKSVWEKVFKDKPFEYRFVDENFEKQYQQDEKQKAIFNYLSIIAVLISCLGLYGLSSFFITLRTKEIGIRKVNGAKVTELLAMLNKDFVKWVAIAFVISCPIAYYAMNKWLQNFSYKTELSWWVFVASGGIALMIALFTVSWQSWRAASRNPVEALRYE